MSRADPKFADPKFARDVYPLTDLRKITQEWTFYEPISVSELFSKFGTFIQKITKVHRMFLF